MRFVFRFPRVSGDVFLESLGLHLVFTLDLGQIPQQFANAGVVNLVDGALVEPGRFQFHDFGLLADF